tara:strand:- start:23 stop:160 length:138 start_codon:yes stop_codon:yes gene_type:complete
MTVHPVLREVGAATIIQLIQKLQVQSIDIYNLAALPGKKSEVKQR